MQQPQQQGQEPQQHGREGQEGQEPQQQGQSPNSRANESQQQGQEPQPPHPQEGQVPQMDIQQGTQAGQPNPQQLINLEANLLRIPPLFVAQMKEEAGVNPECHFSILSYEEKCRLHRVFSETLAKWKPLGER